jgi:hypothetical protein
VNKVSLQKAAAAFFILITLLVTGASLIRLTRVSIDHLQAPHDIFFESHNLATIKSIGQNAPIYSPSFYADLPFVITIYNPLYHYLVAALPAKSDNPFFTGRLVSLISLILCALLFLKLGESGKKLTVPILLIGWVFLISVTVQNAAYLRGDTLALLFSLLAIFLLDGEEGNYRRICLAAILGFIAFAVKQTSISATCACFLFLCSQNWKSARAFLALTCCLYGGFAVLAQMVWGSGYWFSAYLSLMGHPILLNNALRMWGTMLREPLFALLVLVSVLTALEALRRDGSAVLIKSPYLGYLIFATLVLLFTIGKVGSDKIYFLEFIFACFLWILFFRKTYWSSLSRKWIAFLPILVFWGISISELLWADSDSYSYTDKETTRYRQEAYELAAKEIEELRVDKGKILTLNTYVLLYTVQPQAYLNDPYNYWLMWSAGVLDINPLLHAIEKRQFSAILLVSRKNPYSIPAMTFFPASPSTNRLFKTLDKFYFLKKKGVFLYFLPRAELAQH